MRNIMRRGTYNAKSSIAQIWYENKKLLLFLGLFVIIGIVLGVVVAFDPMLNYFRLTRDLLDGNLMNVTKPGRSLFAFIATRFIDFGFAFILVVLLGMTKWTMLFIFPYLSFRAFWAVINIFWIIDRFGAFHGAVLVIIYAIILLSLLVLFTAACVFALKRGRSVQLYGLRCGYRLAEIRRSLVTMTIFLVTIAFIEWLLYFLILSRMLFVFY